MKRNWQLLIGLLVVVMFLADHPALFRGYRHQVLTLDRAITDEKERYNAILPLAQRYNTGIIGLCMDDRGMPETVEDRMRVADSLVGKLIVHGKTRAECLMRLRRALDEMVVDGIETTLPLFRALVREPGIIDGDYHIHWLEQYLAGQAAGDKAS